jgi:NADP-dependent 3-hydroxy acid dehydrogenase YdfG
MNTLARSGMMSADDVAEVVLFVLTRPRNNNCMLETSFLTMPEPSWG